MYSSDCGYIYFFLECFCFYYFPSSILPLSSHFYIYNVYIYIISILEEMQNRADPARPQPVRRVRDVQRLLVRAQLEAELALAAEVELLRHGLVRVLQHLDLGAVHVVAGGQLARGARAEGQRLDARLGGRLDGVGDDVFDGAGGGAGEVEGVFDLHAVDGGQHGEGDEGADGALAVGGVEVPAVSGVAPGVDVRQVDLRAFAVREPVLDAPVDLGAEVLREGFPLRDGDDADALALGAADLARDLALRGGLRAALRVDALLGDAGQAAPAELLAQDGLDLGRAQDPDGLEARLAAQPLQEGVDDAGVLAGVAERVARDDGEAVRGHVRDGGARGAVAPDAVALVAPRGGGRVAVVGDQVLERLQLAVVLGDLQALLPPRRVERRGLRVPQVEDGRPRGQALGVAVEERGEADVADLEDEHEHALEADARARVRGRPPAEPLQVVLHVGGVDAEAAHVLLEHLGVVDALAARDDLLAADEHVERVGVARVVGVGHGVEGARGRGVLVEDEVVGAVLLPHELAQAHLVARVQVLVLGQRGAVLAQPAGLVEHADALREADDGGPVQPDEVLAGELVLDGGDLARVALVQAAEDLLDDRVDDLEHLVVVLLDGHLQVEPRVLGQVAVGVGVLGAEDGADLVDAAEVRRDGHLLGQLGALGEEGGAAEVVDLEDAGAGLGGGALQLGGVDLDEAAGVEGGAEDPADGGLQAEDGLGGGGAQVEDAVCQARAVGDVRAAPVDAVLVLLLLRRADLRLVHAEGHGLLAAHDDVQLVDGDLDVVHRAAQHGHLGRAHLAAHAHDAAGAQALRPLHHGGGGDAGRLVQHALHRRQLLAEDEEDEPRAHPPHDVHARREGHPPADHVAGQRVDGHTGLAGAFPAPHHGQVAVAGARLGRLVARDLLLLLAAGLLRGGAALLAQARLGLAALLAREALLLVAADGAGGRRVVGHTVARREVAAVAQEAQDAAARRHDGRARLLVPAAHLGEGAADRHVGCRLGREEREV
mgnify:CR=1 FL=1